MRLRNATCNIQPSLPDERSAIERPGALNKNNSHEEQAAKGDASKMNKRDSDVHGKDSVVISQSYLKQLQNLVADLQQENKELKEISGEADSIVKDQPKLLETEPIIPSFLNEYGRLANSRTGEQIYIGPSSMTLFALEINKLVKSATGHSRGESLTDHEDSILEKEGNAYRMMLGKAKSKTKVNVNFTLPSYSYALLLVDSFVSYNDGCFYFFNEGIVKENLKRIYNDDSKTGFKPDYGIDFLNKSSENDSTLETIWFCKLLLIFAIGEMYLGTSQDVNEKTEAEQPKQKRQKVTKMKPKSSKLPGSGFFSQASELFTGLFANGSIDNCTKEGSIEVLLLYAFYLQVADCTSASYFYFGLALRASLLLGLHVDVGKNSLNRFELEHRRRLWWTVYMYELMMASKTGFPLTISGDDVLAALPGDFDMSNPPTGCENYIFPEAEFITNCIKITQINASILRRLYTKHPSNNILPSVHEMFIKLLKWKKELPEELNYDFDEEKLNISRLSVNIMTEYLQGINLSVRPLLFHFVVFNIKSGNPLKGKYLDLTKYSKMIWTLMTASYQASINTIKSLWALLPENMLAMFGYLDREYLYNATATYILFMATFGAQESSLQHLDHALIMFTRMRNLGNYPAALRRKQILKLMSLLDFNGTMKPLIEKHDDTIRQNDDVSTNKTRTVIPSNSIFSLLNFCNANNLAWNDKMGTEVPIENNSMFSPMLNSTFNQPNVETFSSAGNDLDLWRNNNQAPWFNILNTRGTLDLDEFENIIDHHAPSDL